jgi:hypothetical protein
VEGVGGEFGGVESDGGEVVGGEGAAVEDEEELVAFGVGGGPVDDEEAADGWSDAKFLADFAYAGAEGDSPGST